MNGSKIGFFSGDIKCLVEDIQILKPTIFISVPRLLNRIYDKVMAGVQSSKAKKWLFDNAYQSKLSEVKNGVLRRDSMWDWLVFGRIQKLLGGNIRGILSSSAPISDRVMEFYQVAFGCYVSCFEFGLTVMIVNLTLTLPHIHIWKLFNAAMLNQLRPLHPFVLDIIGIACMIISVTDN
jgi:long-chain acyl-CoA synthetase